MFNLQKYDLLNLTEEQEGFLIRTGIDSNQLLLAGITSIKISPEIAKKLREDFFHYNILKGEFKNEINFYAIDKKKINSTYKLRQQKGENNTIIDLAKKIVQA